MCYYLLETEVLVHQWLNTVCKRWIMAREGICSKPGFVVTEFVTKTASGLP